MVKQSDRGYSKLSLIKPHRVTDAPPVAFVPLQFFTVIPEEDDEEETPPTNPLEPVNFSDFIGQETAKEIAKIIVDAANKRKQLIPNIMLMGAYGHGKTTLAKLIIKRHHKKVQIIDGSLAETIRPRPDKIYIVDEAHNINSQTADSFNILIDKNELRMIACTTNPGALPAAFRSRFRTIYLEEYEPKDISAIVRRAAKRLNVEIEHSAADTIGNRTKCNPRNALNVLEFVLEMSAALEESQEKVKEQDVNKALERLGIDEDGLTRLDHKYLDLLNPERPVGLQYISSTLSIDSDTIQEEIEPYLLRTKRIERTPRGRIKVEPLDDRVYGTEKEAREFANMLEVMNHLAKSRA